MSVTIVQADYANTAHRQQIVALMNAYATDPMGGGKSLPEDVQARLVKELDKCGFAFSFLAYVDDEPAGLVNCFDGFSTFAAKPLVNVHDIIVLEPYRGLGISQKLLAAVEAIANEKGCCKITLEVLSKNETAKNAYQKFGFTKYELDSETGHGLFWQKYLPTEQA